MAKANGAARRNSGLQRSKDSGVATEACRCMCGYEGLQLHVWLRRPADACVATKACRCMCGIACAALLHVVCQGRVSRAHVLARACEAACKRT